MKSAKRLFICLMMIFSSMALFAEEWYVCTGSFSNEKNAKERCQILDEKGFASFEGVVQVSGKTFYRVFIDKPFETEGKAVAYRNKLCKDSDLVKIDRANFWCVKYSGAKNRYVFIRTGKETVREVVKEVQVPVIKEVVKEVPKEVVKEVPVEKEVIKEVPVEKIVIKEVPVEKIVYRDAPVPETEKNEEQPAQEPPAETEDSAEPVPEVLAVPENVPEQIPDSAPGLDAAPESEDKPLEPEENASVDAEPLAEVPAEETPAEITEEPAPEPLEDVNVDVEGRNLLVKDADTGFPVAGALLSIDGGKWEMESDENGIVEIPSKVKNGTHTILITKGDEYVPTEQELVIAKKKIASANQISIPKKVAYERIKIVLDWGTNPKDLDANIITGGERIYYKNQDIEGIRLDRDDQDSYGPETITIENPDYSKIYSYYVSDYSDDTNEFSNYLSKSGANVVVYKNNDFYKSYSFDHPTNGITWHVFDIQGGEIIEVNKITTDHIEDLVSADSLDFENAK